MGGTVGTVAPLPDGDSSLVPSDIIKAGWRHPATQNFLASLGAD